VVHDVSLTGENEQLAREWAGAGQFLLSNWVGGRDALEKTCTVRGPKANVMALLRLIGDSRAEQSPALTLVKD
jgi:hypothetical protein